MIIELKGVGFRNKGAELMYLAITQRLDRELESPAYVVEPSASFAERLGQPLFQKLWLERAGIQFGHLGRALPAKVRDRYGLVCDHEVDAIVDASGFAYGDVWGHRRARSRMGKYIRGWKRQGKKVVLMPQAFGPFVDRRLADEMKEILRFADLVFARDPVSLRYLNELGQYPSVRSAPDFTNLVDGVLPDGFDSTTKRVAIVPNSKVVAFADEGSGETYVELMSRLVARLSASHRLPYVLIHEGSEDLLLGSEIVERSGTSTPIVEYESAVELKGVLGSADVVIASRFHAAVSALSQGVPTIAFGWSHKYRMLLADYGVEQCSLDHQTESALETALQLAAPESLVQLRSTVGGAGGNEKIRSNTMWSEVVELLRR